MAPVVTHANAAPLSRTRTDAAERGGTRCHAREQAFSADFFHARAKVSRATRRRGTHPTARQTPPANGAAERCSHPLEHARLLSTQRTGARLLSVVWTADARPVVLSRSRTGRALLLSNPGTVLGCCEHCPAHRCSTGEVCAQLSRYGARSFVCKGEVQTRVIVTRKIGRRP